MPPASARASSPAQLLTRLNEAIQAYPTSMAKVRPASGSTRPAGGPNLKREAFYDLGRAMMPTASSPPRTRPGAVIVLSSAGPGGDSDDPRVGGLTDRSGGYQAPVTSGQVIQPPEGDAPRVLLVDDAVAIRNALRGVLEDAGIEVVGEATDGVQGVALTGSLRPDVVLMDLRMPSRDGFEATAQIVQQHPDVRVVVLSAYETEESANAVLAAGAFAFLPKHCEADRIREVVVAAWRSGNGGAT
jgi:CheY-like chemotaxis protein